MEVEIRIPRTTNRQCNRPNYLSNDPAVYYRQAIYIPILKFVTEDLKNRFSEETLNLYNFNILFPDSPALKDKNILKVAINQLAEKYSIFCNTPTAIIEKNIHSEIESW